MLWAVLDGSVASAMLLPSSILVVAVSQGWTGGISRDPDPLPCFYPLHTPRAFLPAPSIAMETKCSKKQELKCQELHYCDASPGLIHLLPA